MARAPAFQAGTPLSNASQNNGLRDGNADPQQYPQQYAAESVIPQDPGLRQVIDAWTTLPPAVRAGIVAMVEASASAPAGNAGKGTSEEP